MQNVKIILSVIIVLFLSSFLSYFLITNTVFAQKVFPVVIFENEKKQFQSIEEFDSFMASISNAQNKPLEINFGNIKYEIPINKLNLKYSLTQLPETGSDPNNITSIAQRIGITNDKDILLDLNFDQSQLISSFPYVIGNDPSFAHFDGEKVVNCEKNAYMISFNETNLAELVKKSIFHNNSIDIPLDEIVTDPTQIDIFDACKNNNDAYTNLTKKLKNELYANKLRSFMAYERKNENEYGYKIENYDAIVEFLKNVKEETKIPFQEGKYSIQGSKAYMYVKYQNGQTLNLDKSIKNLLQWLNDPTTEILSFDNEPANNLNGKYEVIDVSNLLGEGKTRIDIIRNGKYNYGMDNAVYGLRAIDEYVIAPGQEFSFMYDSGSRSGKFHVGGGICNATTTLFRAALESGFKITLRGAHMLYVESYSWGYPLNIVDAAYYVDSSNGDVKFINDIGYPVMLKIEITRDNNNYQYHTIKVYTSPNAPKRKVELYDFKLWNVYSKTQYSGSFSRKVYQNGVVIREDTFDSRYY